MRRRHAAYAVAGLAIVMSWTVHLDAWGAEGHRLILDRAIGLLPPELRSVFQQHRATLVEHANDPDMYRIVGFSEEAPRHFLDIDAYGRDPYPDLPRELGAALQKFGPETITKNGLLPWYTAELYGRLVRAFEMQKSGSPYAMSNILYLSSVLSHYVAEAHQPFHVVVNYDGQLTGQLGIHARFEEELLARYRARFTFSPAPPTPILDPRSAMFTALLASARLAGPLLAADRRASAGRTEYDDGYFDAFLADAKPIVERRMSEAMTVVAAMITGAWEQAGKPDLGAPGARPVRKIRRGTDR
jgi:hypothetical protein